MKLKTWAQNLKKDILALWIAAKDRRTPSAARIIAAALAAYAFSPIDLIPDFIPVIGYVDDLIILPIGIFLALRLIPNGLMVEYREKAETLTKQPGSLVGATLIVVFWIGASYLAARWAGLV